MKYENYPLYIADDKGKVAWVDIKGNWHCKSKKRLLKTLLKYHNYLYQIKYTK